MANTTWSGTDKTAGIAVSGAGLIATSSGASNAVRSADGPTSGKYYWEVSFGTQVLTYGAGCANGTAALATMYVTPTGAAIVYVSGSFYINNVNTGFNLGSFNFAGAFVCFALDITGGLIWARNGAAGNWNASGTANPATGVGGQSVSALGAVALFPAACFGVAANLTARFGDTAFTGTVPSGFTGGIPAAGGGGAQSVRVMVLA